MLVAAILNVRLAAVSHFDVPVHLSLAGGVRSAAEPHVLSMLQVGSMTAAQGAPLAVPQEMDGAERPVWTARIASWAALSQ